MRLPGTVQAGVCGVLALAALLIAAAAPANAQQRDQEWRRPPLSFSTGLEFRRGDHGASLNSDIIYIPNRISYEIRPWTLGVTIPYILITGPGAVTSSGGKPVVFGADKQRLETARGLGDIILSAKYSQSRPQAGPLFEYTGKLKIPTADELQGLGTGEYDFSGQIDASIILGSLMPFGTLGYQVLGDPQDAELNDGIFFSAGIEFDANREYDFGVMYEYRAATIDTIDAAQELVPYVGWTATRRMKAKFFAIMGLTDGSTEYGAGFHITIR